MLANHILKHDFTNKSALVINCGIGHIPVLLAHKGAEGLAASANDLAIELTKKNLQIHHFEQKFRACSSFLKNQISQNSFDFIIIGDHSFSGEIFNQEIEHALMHLKMDGKIIVVLKDDQLNFLQGVLVEKDDSKLKIVQHERHRFFIQFHIIYLGICLNELI